MCGIVQKLTEGQTKDSTWKPLVEGQTVGEKDGRSTDGQDVKKEIDFGRKNTTQT